MFAVTDNVVVRLDRNDDGDLVLGEAAEALSADAARRRSQALVGKHAGTVALSRTGDPKAGAAFKGPSRPAAPRSACRRPQPRRS